MGIAILSKKKSRFLFVKGLSQCVFLPVSWVGFFLQRIVADLNPSPFKSWILKYFVGSCTIPKMFRDGVFLSWINHQPTVLLVHRSQEIQATKPKPTTNTICWNKMSGKNTTKNRTVWHSTTLMGHFGEDNPYYISIHPGNSTTWEMEVSLNQSIYLSQ